MSNQLVNLDKDWKPIPPLEWRLEFGYVTDGDPETDEAKKWKDLTHLKMWQARLNFAANNIPIQKDGLSGNNDDGNDAGETSQDAGRRMLYTLASWACPGLLLLWKDRLQGEHMKGIYKNDVSKLQSEIDAYVKAHGGDVGAILTQEREARLQTGKIIMPDITITDNINILPHLEIIPPRAQNVVEILAGAGTAFNDDIAYWFQLKWWIAEEVNLQNPNDRHDKSFYNSPIFNPTGADPRKLP